MSLSLSVRLVRATSKLFGRAEREATGRLLNGFGPGPLEVQAGLAGRHLPSGLQDGIAGRSGPPAGGRRFVGDADELGPADEVRRRDGCFGPRLVLCHGLAGEAAEPCRFGLAGPAPGPRVLAVCGGGAPPPEPSSGTTGNYNKRPWPVASRPRTAPPALSATRRRPRTGGAGAPAVFSATDGPNTSAGRSFSTVTLTLA